MLDENWLFLIYIAASFLCNFINYSYIFPLNTPALFIPIIFLISKVMQHLSHNLENQKKHYEKNAKILPTEEKGFHVKSCSF